ncbi:PREDICTED: arf-GAP with GTPase, ANK repeat and PH domain-containing protein 3-like [Acropora digitifera]|uniref:arf-GAP with GTPase, ANK repeat and PH domain-containing protein 3-like n=1 Tax=Acropora digitifera TaxID=70779 RepID=UPI00077ACD20|nr:PREDICTED: arf-GAP with GTPase, ANK repeat and PH domain-containing protein 3-like [Acropora digitifera]
MDSLLSNLHRSMPLITESFLNSPEFTSLRVDSSCELRLGILGSSISGKSDLVHRYLTGEYAKVDSFTGRHKKEISFDGQSHLLLIRNETGPPDLQTVDSNLTPELVNTQMPMTSDLE